LQYLIIKRVEFEIYDSYFANCHVTVQLNSVIQSRDNSH